MKKYLSIFFATAIMVLLFPVATMAKNNIIAIDNILPYTFVVNNHTFYVFSREGEVLSVDKSGATELIESQYDIENAYPLSMQGRLFALQRGSGEIAGILSNELDSTAARLSITQELAGGGDDWHVTDIKTDPQHIYFMLSINGEEPELICRYSMPKGELQHLQIDDLLGYAPISETEVYAFSIAPNGVNAHRLKWDGSSKHLEYTLSPEARVFAYDSNQDRLYYSAEGSFFYAQAGSAEAGLAPSPFAREAVEALINEGELAVLTRSGLVFPSFSSEVRQRQVLRVLGGSNPLDTQFLIEHPEVSIEYVSMAELYETMDLSTALITGAVQYDVAQFSNVTSAFEQIRKKGYLQDLSAYPELVEQVDAMYPAIKDFCWYDGKLQLIPNFVDPKTSYTVSSLAMEEMDLSYDRLPKTIEELLDFMIEWYTEHGEPQDGEPNLFSTENPRESLTMTVLSSYEAYYRHKNEQIEYDTELLRRLLGKAEQAASLCPAYDGSQNWSSRLINFINEDNDMRKYLPLPVDPTENPLYDARLNGFSVHPKSEAKEIAAQYILHQIRHVDATQRALLFQGKHEPVENPVYQQQKLDYQIQMDALDAAIAQEESEVEKRQHIEQENRVQAQFEENEKYRYSLSHEDIDFYQQQLLPKINFPYISLTRDNSIQNQETRKLVKAYIQGVISLDDFVRTLDQRNWLMTRENQ